MKIVIKTNEINKILSDTNKFSKDICKKIYGQYSFLDKMKTPPKAHFFKEVTIRKTTDEKTRFGKDKPKRYRFDVIYLVKPHYAAYQKELFSVGVEVKASKEDLKKDNKFLEYLGYTDYFFFAVPTYLLDIVRDKINEVQELEQREYIGIIEIKEDSFEILEMPKIQNFETENQFEIYKELSFKNI